MWPFSPSKYKHRLAAIVPPHAYTTARPTRHYPGDMPATPRTFLLAGASGFLGTALRIHLAEEGHRVVRLVRRAPATGSEFRWDPARGQLDDAVLDGVDTVVNLGGAGVADRPWTYARRQQILLSRRESTLTLARALSRSAARGQRPTLIQGSAIGWYGTRSEAAPFTEEQPAADDWLASVVRRWEAAAAPAADAGLRVAYLRTSPVMDRSGGPLRLMMVPWSLGLGAVLGDGNQHMAMITLSDWLRAVAWIADHDQASGPYNLTLPEPTTNRAFTDTLAQALQRPRIIRAPAAVIRRGVGELAEQLVGDQFVVPQKLLDEGFRFTAPDVTRTIGAALTPGVESAA